MRRPSKNLPRRPYWDLNQYWCRPWPLPAGTTSDAFARRICVFSLWTFHALPYYSLLSFFQMKSAVHLFNSGRKTILFLSFHTISQSILQNELHENRLFTFLHFFYQEILSSTAPHFVPRSSPVSKYSIVQNHVLLIQPFLTNFPQKTVFLLSVLSIFVKISKYFSNICRKFIAVQ